MVGAWHGMACVNQTRSHCVNQMGKTHSKPLVARHGRGTAWARHGHGMLCVNGPLMNIVRSSSVTVLSVLIFGVTTSLFTQQDNNNKSIKVH